MGLQKRIGLRRKFLNKEKITSGTGIDHYSDQVLGKIVRKYAKKKEQLLRNTFLLLIIPTSVRRKLPCSVILSSVYALHPCSQRAPRLSGPARANRGFRPALSVPHSLLLLPAPTTLPPPTPSIFAKLVYN